MRRPVLIVIDMLNDFLESWASAPREELIQSTNSLIGLMRQRGYPLVWIRQEFEPDLRDAFREMRAKRIRITIKGTYGCQIASELTVAPSDHVIIKKRYSAFYGTSLDQELEQLKPDALILAGINAHAAFA